MSRMPNQEAAPVADMLVKEWVCHFGVPMELHSDEDEILSLHFPESLRNS